MLRLSIRSVVYSPACSLQDVVIKRAEKMHRMSAGISMYPATRPVKTSHITHSTINDVTFAPLHIICDILWDMKGTTDVYLFNTIHPTGNIDLLQCSMWEFAGCFSQPCAHTYKKKQHFFFIPDDSFRINRLITWYICLKNNAYQHLMLQYDVTRYLSKFTNH